jgi:hypothetical protein
MRDEEEYRRQAAEAEKQAGAAGNELDREQWLRIAQAWMSMLRKRSQSGETAFDAESQAKGTGQEDSESSH